MKLTLALLAAGLIATVSTVVYANRPDPVRSFQDDIVISKLKLKREIARELCIAMASSGAYAQLDDNQLSNLCIFTATHLVDNAYDHND